MHVENKPFDIDSLHTWRSRTTCACIIIYDDQMTRIRSGGKMFIQERIIFSHLCALHDQPAICNVLIASNNA